MEIFVGFTVLWVATFFPAWRCMLWLVAFSVADKPLKSLKFLTVFVLYRLLIVAPYIWLLIVGKEQLPDIIQSIIIGFLVFGVALALLRFVFRTQTKSTLWNIYAAVYDGLTVFYPYKTMIQRVVEVAQISNDDRVVDLGGGTGNVAELMQDKARSITIVDSSKPMLNRARSKLKQQNIMFVESTIEKYVQNARPSSADVIVLSNSLYAVEGREEFWINIHSMLSDGGKVIISNSDRKGSWPIIIEHITNRGVISLLRPRLIAIFIIDQLISDLSDVGSFSFISYEQIIKETSNLFTAKYIERLYGGGKNGVNILFTLKKI